MSHDFETFDFRLLLRLGLPRAIFTPAKGGDTPLLMFVQTKTAATSVDKVKADKAGNSSVRTRQKDVTYREVIVSSQKDTQGS